MRPSECPAPKAPHGTCGALRRNPEWVPESCQARVPQEGDLRELYIILGRIGWVWLGIWLVLVVVGLLVQHHRRRRNGVRGFEVTASDEKQS